MRKYYKRPRYQYALPISGVLLDWMSPEEVLKFNPLEVDAFTLDDRIGFSAQLQREFNRLLTLFADRETSNFRTFELIMSERVI